MFGEDRSAVLRPPGWSLWPQEYVGRLPWWLDRVAVGGRVLAPGSPDRSIQPVDVRDLAEFAIRSAALNILAVSSACRSTWLNGGVPASHPGRRGWAGRGVDVLLRIYAKCIVGQDEIAKRRIREALRDVGDSRT